VLVRADVLRLAGRDARAVLEEHRRLLERRDVRRVAPALVDEGRIGIRKHDGSVNVDVLHVTATGLTARDDTFDGARMATQLRERRAEGLASLWVPLGSVDIDEPARALHVDEVDGVRCNNPDVDLECLAVT